MTVNVKLIYLRRLKDYSMYGKFDNPFGRGMPVPPVRGMYTLDHERHHLSIQLEQYKKLQQDANPYERCYTNATCTKIAADIVTELKEYHYAVGKADSASFDVSAYGLSHPKGGAESASMAAAYDAKAAQADTRLSMLRSKMFTECGYVTYQSSTTSNNIRQ